MKTIVKIELTDAQRNQLKILADGKPSKKLFSRKEVDAIVQQFIGGLLGQADPPKGDAASLAVEALRMPSDLYKVDPDDIPLMNGRHTNPGFVRGWNLVKRGAAR